MNPAPPAPPAYPGLRALHRSAFQGSVHGAPVDLYTLGNPNGVCVKVCNYGARIVQIVMPDAAGRLGDVALGFNDLAGLLRPAPQGVPSMGAFIGRYANRIANASFAMDGAQYRLSKNSGEHCIHGGAGGSRYAVFAAQQTASHQLVLCHRFSPETDGFPGTVDLTLTYTLTQNNALHIDWQAVAGDVPTVGNFTSHVFFNLGHEHSQPVATHQLELNASHYLPLNVDLSPTGQLLPVAQTPFDFLSAKFIAAEIDCPHPQLALCGGYDHHFAIDAWNAALKHVATVFEPASGRRMAVHSTEPGVQLFTANGLNQAASGFAPRSGLCVEPSYFPDSPNHAHFPSTRIEADATRTGQIIYAFDTV